MPSVEELFAHYPDAKRIGILGSADNADETRTRSIKAFLKNVFAHLPRGSVIKITGGTKGGIPELASNDDSGVPVCAVTPACGVKYRIDESHRDISIVVPPYLEDMTSQWGSEASTLVGLCHAVIVFGGNWGTAIELAHIMKINERRLKKGQKPIYVLIRWHNRNKCVSDDILNAALRDPRFESIFLRETPVISKAVNFLKEKLNL